MLLEKEIIDYKDNVNDIEHWVYLKGYYRYTAIIRFLKKKHIECTWDNVTNYIKYDKRLLINSFKYIVFLEEMYKATIKRMNHKKSVINMSFRRSYEMYVEIGEQYDDVDLETMNKYKEQIISFRNAVVHNKILLGRRFRELDLEDLTKNLIVIIPKSYREGFIKDILNCSIGLANCNSIFANLLMIDQGV